MSDTLYEKYTTGDDNEYISGGGYTAILGQSFTVGNTGTNEDFNITSVKLKCSKNFTPTGNVTFNIYLADVNGKPTGSSISNGTLDITTISTSVAWTEISMASSSSCEASTQYVLTADGTSLSTNGFNWRGDFTSPTYSGGVALRYYSPNWYLYSSVDMLFEIYGTTVASGTNTQINIGDDWKEIEAAQINIGDTWKEVAGMQINIGDAWKEIF